MDYSGVEKRLEYLLLPILKDSPRDVVIFHPSGFGSADEHLNGSLDRSEHLGSRRGSAVQPPRRSSLEPVDVDFEAQVHRNCGTSSRK